MARYIFTSTGGGASTTPYASLNLGTHVGDHSLSVHENRKLLAEYLSLTELVFMNQTHGIDVVEIGDVVPPEINADAIITKRRSLGLAVLTADCIPLLIEGKSYIAAVHVGRKGLMGGIIPRVVEALKQRGEKKMSAWIGPAICGKCYEVPLAMYHEVISAHPAAATNETAHTLDLPSAAQAQLESLDLTVEQVDVCTLESVHHFSYRKTPTTGRMAGIISL